MIYGDYRRDFDWWMDSLTTYTRHSELHFTDHWHTQTSVLSLLQHPLTISWQRPLKREILQLPDTGPLVTAAHAEFLSTDYSSNWVPGWQPFHTNLLVFFSRADFQLNSLNNQPATSLHLTQLNYWQLIVTWLVSSLYKLGAGPTENTASNNTSIVVMAVAYR
jgi:hypothetical protein